MRDYRHLDDYYNELIQDIYPQPLDIMHKKWTEEIVNKVVEFLPECKSVLDVGCGEAYAQELFNAHNIVYVGMCLGSDYDAAKASDRNVVNQDFNFSRFPNGSVDLVFSRHSLEHSPFPILTLMEWHRIASRWLCLVMPNPDHFSYIGRNHYAVMYPKQLRWLLRRSGWKLLWRQSTLEEYRCICSKEPRISSEGWAEEPLPNKVYEDDRDDI